MGLTETRDLAALFLHLQRAVCVCAEQGDEGAGQGSVWEGGSAVLEHPEEAPGQLLRPSACPCPWQPTQ